MGLKNNNIKRNCQEDYNNSINIDSIATAQDTCILCNLSKQKSDLNVCQLQGVTWFRDKTSNRAYILHICDEDLNTLHNLEEIMISFES